MRPWTPAERIESYLSEMLAKFYNWTEAALYTDAETALHHKSTLVERLREKIA